MGDSTEPLRAMKTNSVPLIANHLAQVMGLSLNVGVR